MTTPNAPLHAVLVCEEVGAADNLLQAFDFGKIRIKRIWALPEVAQAAHASILLEVKVGTVADTDRYAHLTNDSDLASSAVTDPDGVIVTSAWAAFTTKELDFAAKTVGNAPDAAAPGTPGGSYPEHSGPLHVQVIKAGTTPDAGRVTVGMDYFPSD